MLHELARDQLVLAVHDWAAVTNGILACVVVLALVVALFQERLRQWLSRAQLSMTILAEMPETVMIEMTDPQTGRSAGKSVWVRVRVTHESGPPAENVEIEMARLWRVADGKAELVKSFLPLSLRWANRMPPTETERIPKGLSRYCDLCVFSPNTMGETWVQFTTLVQPNPVGNIGYPNVQKAGGYELELTLVGDNVRPVTKRWSLAFDSSWSNDEATMLGRIRVREIDDSPPLTIRLPRRIRSGALALPGRSGD
jgi:hypothetical protein